ncbi:MAG: glycosyltransferase family 4 protein [Acidimicrobiia bacterium]
MRITYVIQRYGREVVGGGESFCRSFATRLAARGHEVSVVTGRALDYLDWADHYPEGSEDIDGVTVHRLPSHQKADNIVLQWIHNSTFANPAGPVELHYAWQRAQGPLLHTLDSWLTDHQREIDILVPVTQFYFPATEALLMSKRLSLPTLFHPLAHEDHSLSLSLFDKVFDLATGFGFLTEEEENLVRGRFGCRQPGLIHGVGCDLDPPVDRAALSNIKLPTVPYVCYVGRCDPHKIADAVDFIRQFRARHGRRVELVIIGKSQDWLRSEPGITTTGFLEDGVRNAVLERSLGLIMPSPFESFSMVLTESWALRRPAIVNGNCGPLRGQAERSGGALPYSNYDDFEAALLKLLDEPGLADRMGLAGRAYTERRYEWNHVIDQYEDFLERLAPPRRKQTTAAASGRTKRAVAPTARTSDKRTSLRWEGALLKHHSLSEVNRHLVTALADNPSLRVAIGAQREGADITPTGTLAQLARGASETPAPSTQVTVRHQWPPVLEPVESGSLAVIQPWEFGCIPLNWVDALATVDEFWVPSEWVRQCYLASGVPAERVVTIRNGIDLDRFAPDGPRYALPTTKATKFLFVGGTIVRKGIDVLLSAYVETFRAHDDVTLVIKGYGSGGVYAGSSLTEIIEAIAAAPGAPEVIYIDDDLSPSDMAGLYRACNVLVHPYRGEGFGLPVAEAMACGLAVITTAGGPTDEFCPTDIAYRIPATPTAIAIGALGLPICAGPLWWLEPDPRALAETMRRVACDRSEIATLGQRAAAHAQTLSWTQPVGLVNQRIAALASSPSSRAGRVPADQVPQHPGAPGAVNPPSDVAVLIAVGDATETMAMLEQLEGTAIDGASFRVLIDASEATESGAALIEQLDGVAVVSTPEESMTIGELADALAGIETTRLVRLAPGVVLTTGWWRLLDDALQQHPGVEVLGSHGAVRAMTTDHLRTIAAATPVNDVFNAVALRTVPNALVRSSRPAIDVSTAKSAALSAR